MKFVSIFILVITSQLLAGISPFSVEGLGLQAPRYLARGSAMGQSGMADNEPGQLNPANHSFNAFDDKTSFGVMGLSELNWIEDANNQNLIGGSDIPYFGMAFHFGFLGKAGVEYFQRFERDFQFDASTAANEEKESLVFEGGIFEWNLWWAYDIHPRFAISTGVHWALGRERLITKADLWQMEDETINGRDLEGDTIFTRRNGIYPEASLTYRSPLVNVAFSFIAKSQLETKQSRSLPGLEPSVEIQAPPEDLPWAGNLGIAWKLKTNQTLTMDIGYQLWNEISENLRDDIHIGTGYEFRGEGSNLDSYWERMAFRGGLFLHRAYTGYDAIEVSTGVGLPLGRRNNPMDIALTYGHRGSLAENKISGDFMRISVTFTGIGEWGKTGR